MVDSLPTKNGVDSSTFFQYAKRLRSLTLGTSNGHDDIPTLSLVRLADLQAPGNPFFPGLKSVAFTSSHVPQTTAIYGTLALASPITSLEFTALEVETATFATMLAFFSNRFSGSLTYLNLTFPVNNRDFTMESLRFLPRFQALRSLTLFSKNPRFPIFDKRLMDWILNLESLENLKIDVCVVPTDLDTTTHHGKQAISARLHTLRLGGPLNFIDFVLPMFAHRGVQITALTLAPIGGYDPGPIRAFVQSNFPNALNSLELLRN
ncbi:hypothetical protein EST38_g13944 [Candolleomyces aberdarensis]|uniref:Uncharacterized protein n=1 Tax=Candolleomyces aberdarensis TaxID=2316362 RepID=A0A4Q2CYK1_9AGAR|nr:hypothetical protein EST38_g13944 [Candolleomyces aberdarensis]